MPRFAILLVCFVCCPTVNGFPVPKPKEPPNKAELIIGMWEDVSNPYAYEFTELGSLTITRAGDLTNLNRYSFDGEHLVVRVNREDTHYDIYFSVKLLTNQRLILSRNGDDREFIRKLP